MPLSSSPKMRALTIGSFILGITLYGVGLYYAFVNIDTQQELTNPRKEAVKEWLRKRKTKDE